MIKSLSIKLALLFVASTSIAALGETIAPHEPCGRDNAIYHQNLNSPEAVIPVSIQCEDREKTASPNRDVRAIFHDIPDYVIHDRPLADLWNITRIVNSSFLALYNEEETNRYYDVVCKLNPLVSHWRYYFYASKTAQNSSPSDYNLYKDKVLVDDDNSRSYKISAIFNSRSNDKKIALVQEYIRARNPRQFAFYLDELNCN